MRVRHMDAACFAHLTWARAQEPVGTVASIERGECTCQGENLCSGGSQVRNRPEDRYLTSIWLPQVMQRSATRNPTHPRVQRASCARRAATSKLAGVA